MHIFDLTSRINYRHFQKLNLNHSSAILRTVYREFIVWGQLVGFHFLWFAHRAKKKIIYVTQVLEIMHAFPTQFYYLTKAEIPKIHRIQILWLLCSLFPQVFYFCSYKIMYIHIYLCIQIFKQNLCIYICTYL